MNSAHVREALFLQEFSNCTEPMEAATRQKVARGQPKTAPPPASIDMIHAKHMEMIVHAFQAIGERVFPLRILIVTYAPL